LKYKILFSVFILSIFNINCFHSIDSYTPRDVKENITFTIKETLVSQNCQDEDSFLFSAKKDALIKEFQRQIQFRNNRSLTENEPIEQDIQYSLIWYQCEFSSEPPTDEEWKEYNTNQLKAAFSFLTLGLLPFYSEIRSHLKIKSKLNGYECESLQAVRAGTVIHLFYLPMVFYSQFSEEPNRQILKVAINRGLDDNLLKYYKGECKNTNL